MGRVSRGGRTWILGAGGQAWYWHRVVPELTERGHDAIAVDLPAADQSAGLSEYADAVVDAIGDRTRLILVAQSMGAFTAPIVCERVPVDLLVLVNAMIPKPGESAGDWWASTGQEAAQRDYLASIGLPSQTGEDLRQLFFHDVRPDIVEEAFREEPPQADKPFSEPWPLKAWPDVPTRVLISREDHLFPATFQRHVVKDRLGIAPDEMDGGHLVALSRPGELVEHLERFRAEPAARP
jgi:pimeloyl-ACP methyl ester carboxylesterase